MDTVDDNTTLEQDATLDEPLRRVAYEAGMMLGLEATRDEQAYHRRRLSRHQYWLDGFGTLAGMRVSMTPSTHVNSTDPIAVRLLVSPGIGVDGLGRDVLIYETYYIDLGEWLTAQTEAHLREGYSDADDLLWLKVCVRQKDTQVAKQPVLARKLNLSTDAVEPSRTAESVLLELIPELPESEETQYHPWACHPSVASSDPALTKAEQKTLDDVTAASAAAGAQLALHARLLHALDTTGVSVEDLNKKFEIGARLLLARVAITTKDVNAIVVNPQLISINNLARPFLVSASQLAWLSRQP
jgi:hypothetical protein